VGRIVSRRLKTEQVEVEAKLTALGIILNAVA
jgi:hypothetical protein